MYPILFGKNKIKILGVKDIYPFLNNEQTQEKMTESIQEEARNKKKIKRLSDVYAGLFH
jgi:hypothetical protein